MVDWQSLRWELPLGTPPRVVAIGRNAHGFDPVDRYCLPDLWSLHVYGYTASLKLDGRELPIRPGYVGITPPGTQMEYRYTGISVHIYAHFRAGNGVTRSVPAMQDLREGYDSLFRRLQSVIGETNARIDARVWDLLWDLTAFPEGADARVGIHPAVRKATDLLERNLAEPLTVQRLADEAEVSTGHLVRLFREAHGDTVIGYLRRRRLERARHLLERSTLSIKFIAASVGIPDLQHFNKAIRTEYGASPRELRQRYASSA
jgi:AraC-like DNA-binding protein